MWRAPLGPGTCLARSWHPCLQARAWHVAGTRVSPVQLAREGEQQLRVALGSLNLEQLRDVVADYGMDPGKLVMKWRDAERVVDRIVEVAVGRAHKGSAFSGAVSDIEAASDTAPTAGVAERKD